MTNQDSMECQPRVLLPLLNWFMVDIRYYTPVNQHSWRLESLRMYFLLKIVGFSHSPRDIWMESVLFFFGGVLKKHPRRFLQQQKPKLLNSLKLTAIFCTWKNWMVGKLLSFWDGLFSIAMLVSGRVSSMITTGGLSCQGVCTARWLPRLLAIKPLDSKKNRWRWGLWKSRSNRRGKNMKWVHPRRLT